MFQSGIFDEKDHLLQRITRKDHLQKKLPKKITFLWQQDVPNDTWHLPLLIVAAGPGTTVPGGTLGGRPAPFAGAEAVHRRWRQDGMPLLSRSIF
jgi:hypothetical protein